MIHANNPGDHEKYDTNVGTIAGIRHYTSGNKLVIVAPGFSVHKEAMRGEIKYLNDANIDTLLIDLPGQGKSTGITSITNTKKAYRQVIGKLKTDKDYHIGILGHSLAGMSAITLGEEEANYTNPNLEAIVTYGLPRRIQDGFPISLENMEKIPHKIAAVLTKMYNSFQNTINNHHAILTGQRMQGDDRNAFRIGSFTSGNYHESFRELSEDIDIADSMEKVKVPMMHVWGSEDTICKYEDQKRYSSLIDSKSQIIIMQGLNHHLNEIGLINYLHPNRVIAGKNVNSSNVSGFISVAATNHFDRYLRN